MSALGTEENIFGHRLYRSFPVWFQNA